METKEITRERLSAFSDGELADQHVDLAFASLRSAEGRAEWDLYHQIGDVLRSDDMALALSPGFSARMAARLDAEPTIVAPASLQPASGSSAAPVRRVKRWAMPGMAAAAAMAAVAFVTTPQLMVAMKGSPAPVAPYAVAAPDSLAAATAADSSVHAAQGVVVAAVPEGVVLRDPRIDEYLIAHQRFSPSVYSTAQYARSATFAMDSDK